MIRTYALKHAINIGKQKKILEIVREYRKLACQIASWQWKEFYRNGGFDRNLDIKKLETKLSERYKQTCQYQVVGVLDSFLSNRQNDFAKMVYNSPLREKAKAELYYINRGKLWFKPSGIMPEFDEKGKRVPGKTESISEERIKLARAIWKHIVKKHHRPCLKRCNMALDNKVARVREKEEGAKKFDYWIELSTLNARKTIHLPLISNRYFEQKEGITKKFCQIHWTQEKEIQISLVKELEKKEYVPETPKIALDFGLQNLFSTDKGDLYGHTFFEILKKYDGYISALAQNRQRQKLPTKSHAYNGLVSNVRDFLKNEICRVINHVIEKHKPKEIIVEKLQFTSPRLSRRLNRILSNMGRKIIKQKLDAISEEFDIVITSIPAAYTSQMCHICGYVDKNNRPSQASFSCRYCHNKIHADINAARNILSRSSDKMLSKVYLSKEAILQIIAKEFMISFPDAFQHSSTCMQGNPYFSQYRPKKDLSLSKDG